MLDLLSSIANVISSILDFVIHFFGSFITYFGQLPRTLQFTNTAIQTLPSVLIVYATVAVSVYVLLFILGRQG